MKDKNKDDDLLYEAEHILHDILDYTGGANNALEDEYVMERAHDLLFYLVERNKGDFTTFMKNQKQVAIKLANKAEL